MGFWNYNKDPSKPGWFPVLVGYEEGTFPQAAYWDGVKWNRKSVFAYGGISTDEKEAEWLAYTHDPDA